VDRVGRYADFQGRRVERLTDLLPILGVEAGAQPPGVPAAGT